MTLQAPPIEWSMGRSLIAREGGDAARRGATGTKWDGDGREWGGWVGRAGYGKVEGRGRAS